MVRCAGIVHTSKRATQPEALFYHSQLDKGSDVDYVTLLLLFCTDTHYNDTDTDTASF